MSDKRKLRVWAEPERGDDDDDIPRPMPGEALYTRPNPSGTRKSCGNCIHWIADEAQCRLMDEDIVVPGDAICGYHVFGRPLSGAVAADLRRDMQPVDPEFSGFDRVPGGVSCDRCAHFERVDPLAGKCELLMDPDTGADFEVDALACCAHWVTHG